MQVEGYVKCMQTNFGGRGLSGFGDIRQSMKGREMNTYVYMYHSAYP